uniref:Putative effector protein n=1 Tax=Heterodera avenae TaxID=34510 RepID=A0A2L0VDK3_HETAV|nr:putative effector protein [Heterodera avenae]
MAVSALLLLLPLLLGVQKIPEESVQSDANAVFSTILSLDKPRNVIDSPDAPLTVPQKALFKMHWELETVQSEKPGAPPQFDLALFAEALEAFVEMDEATKEVRLSKDKLNEWAGVEKEEEKEEPKIVVDEEAKGSEKAKATEEGTKGADATGTVPEVRVNANGNFEVMNGAGRDGKMEVRRQKDENGNEQVVVTFVKEDEAEGPAKGEKEIKPKEGDNNDQQQQEQKPKANLEERTKMENMANNASSVVPSSISPLSAEEDDVGSFFNLLFGRRKKRTTVVRENVQRTEDGQTIRTTEKLTTLGKPGAGFTKVFNYYTVSMDKGGEQPQGYWPKSQNGTIESSESESAGGQDRKDYDDEQQLDEQEAEIKQCSKGEKEQYERKAEIKQYLDQGMANAKGKMKNWEKLAYIWYSQLLYWTAKWIEVLEKRMAGVDTELAQDFLCSNTGLAAYKELNCEMKKYEVKLAKLKEWIGQYFK